MPVTLEIVERGEMAMGRPIAVKCDWCEESMLELSSVPHKGMYFHTQCWEAIVEEMKD